MKLQDKTFLVMGAGGLLGKEIVKDLLFHGASVLAVDRTLSAMLSLDHPNLVKTEGDLTSVESIKAAFSTPGIAFDGAVNTAYPRTSTYGRKFFDVTFESFNENVSLHLGGYFLFMQQAAQYALDSDRKFSLVSLSSVYGVIAPRFDLYDSTPMTMPVEYAAIKAAILHLNSYVNAMMKGTSFRANSVSPGGIYDAQPEAFKAKYDAHCRHKGMLDPKDILGAISFLLSDDSEFVCGQNIIVDDGFVL